MVEFKPVRVSERILRIWAPGLEQMYLVTGEKRAALIDTGSGAGDLLGFVRRYTDLPLVVLLTHNHMDHAMGSAQFEEVWLSREDIDGFDREHADRDRRWRLKMEAPSFTQIEESDYISIDDPARYCALNDGDRFDLGGLTIRAVALPGHTPGSMMFLVEEERTLLLGDACGNFTMMQGATSLPLSRYKAALRMAKTQTDGLYNRLCLSHDDLNPPLDLFERMIELIEEIHASKDDRVPFHYMDTAGFIAKRCIPVENGPYGTGSNLRVDGGFPNMIYDPARA